MTDEATQSEPQAESAQPAKPKMGLIDGFKRRRAPRQTGFALLDAPAHGRWPGPRPRGMIWTLTLLAVLGGLVFGGAIAGFEIYAHFYDISDLSFGGPFLAAVFAALAAPFMLHALLRDRRSPAAMGLSLSGVWRAPVWALVGALLSLPTLIAILVQYDISILPQVVRMTALTIPIFFVQTAAEEIIFRGWFLQTLGARYGARVAVLVGTLVFAALHYDYGATVEMMAFYVLLIVPVGLSLALLVLKQGSLWGAIGLHWGWNTIQFASMAPLAIESGEDPWDIFLQTTIAWEDVLTLDSVASIGGVAALLLLMWFYARDVRARWSAKPPSAMESAE